MQYQALANTDLKVSKIGLGTWAYGDDTFGSVEDKQSIKAIRAAVESGINLIDTAPAYGAGKAEKIVGEAIKDLRDQVIIATKCGTHREGSAYVRDLSPAQIRKELDLSLTRLQVSQIDIYQIHWPDPDTPLEESLAELLKLKKAGKFKYLGVCNFELDLLKKISKLTDIVSLQPQYSLLERKIETKLIPYLLQTKQSTLSYGTLGGGILSGKYDKKPEFKDEKDNRANFYPFFKEENWQKTADLIKELKNIADKYDKTPAQVAINWSINQPGITAALVGAKTEQQARENASAADFKLTQAELIKLSQKSTAVIKELTQK